MVLKVREAIEAREYVEQYTLDDSEDGKFRRSKTMEGRFGRQLTIQSEKKSGESRSGSPVGKTRKLEIIQETVKISKKEGDRP